MSSNSAFPFRKRFLPAFVAIAACLFVNLPCGEAWAQATDTGTVSGQVTDQQGAAIAGAELKLTDVSTGNVRTTVSNDTGRYTLVNVDPGVYNIEARKSGFALAKIPEQKVDVGLVLTINIPMQVGSTSTTVEVQAQAGAELQTTNATVGSTITGKSIEALPNLGRDANAFVLLQPGVAPGGQVAGAVADQNAYQLDGAGNSSDMDGNQSTYTQASGYIGSASTGGAPSGVMPTPAESIEEFKVGTTNQTADFNQSAGGQIQMVTKRGTNQFHGSLYDFYLGSNFGANFWKSNHTPSPQLGLPYTPLPSSHQNRFGASLGGILLPNFAGGRTYFFANYEGRRFPQVTTVEKTVPSDLLRAGVIQIPNSANVLTAYNINPYPVTVNGVTYAACSGAAYCDPRGIGLNPLIRQVWTQQMPRANDLQFGDSYNTQGYLSAIRLPQNSDFGVIRLDHDFGSNWHFMSSYRYYNFQQATSNQVDIGGTVSGAPLGQATPLTNRVQKPWFLVAALTTTITPNMTNDLHVSYLRNYWQWFSASAPVQFPGLGGAMEIGGEASNSTLGGGPNALMPYNVDAQDVRQRFWDGKDKSLRDDLSYVKGNHLIQFGGQYQRNYDYHQRNDNGAGIFTANVYQIGNGSGINFNNNLPLGLPNNQVSNWDTYYGDVLGLVSQPQTLLTRAGNNLTLQPLGTPLFDNVIIPSYNLYFSDTWRVRKDFTFTYGLSWTLEMPPYEVNGKQVELVDASGKPLSAQSYLSQVQTGALAGRPDFAPTIGFSLIRNVKGASTKYPYNPYYKSFSPRLSAAWNPSFDSGIMGSLFGQGKTVIRGGYSRIYGRLNGVDLVLVPLLGPGNAQTLQCLGISSSGQCLSSGTVTPATSFRIGVDGSTVPLPAVSQTLPQPYYPAVGGNAAAGDGSVLDPNFQPNRSDQFDFTIQRSLGKNMSIELGYIGRIITKEYQGIDINAVPTMATLGGQSFANAYANTYLAVGAKATPSPQPFFEAALGGPTSAYCAKFASCTAAVASNLQSNFANTQVYNIWKNLSGQPSWTLGRTMITNQIPALFMETSTGHGNYNGAFVSFSARNYHGLTATSNFTWSRALGTASVQQSTSQFTVINPWNIDQMYGPQPFDIRFVYNLNMLYEIPFMRTQKGALGRILGGWSVAPLFTAQSGAPLPVNIGTGSNQNCQSFGESVCDGSVSTYENAIPAYPYPYGNSAHNNVTGTGSIASTGNPAGGGSGINIFPNPAAAYADFRRPILGIDTTSNGYGVLRGFPTWNLDLAVNKTFTVTERMSVTFVAQFSNVLNHFQPSSITSNFTTLDSPTTWGVVRDQSNTPRQIEFGLRVFF